MLHNTNFKNQIFISAVGLGQYTTPKCSVQYHPHGKVICPLVTGCFAVVHQGPPGSRDRECNALGPGDRQLNKEWL
jgi:hypothetical protein